ncbi:hypothetical protein ACL6C3_17200 [Capilliphycus salinus ALCB114379]|uniref:hypothetical protein n=1 Tax=Capilliphycus salinus TaxID=2768948 RepID=UPI0039A5480B
MRKSLPISGVLAATTTVFSATTPAFAFTVGSNGSVVGIKSGDIGDYFQFQKPEIIRAKSPFNFGINFEKKGKKPC